MGTRQAESVLASAKLLQSASRRCHKVTFRQASGAIGKRDYATHWVHSYPAKMFHRIPQAIIDRTIETRDLRVLDPFCGSGTVLVEAMLHGHDAIGIDVNPLARMISRVKTTPVDSAKLLDLLPTLLEASKLNVALPSSNKALSYWFKPQIQSTIESLCREIHLIEESDVRRFYKVCLSSIVRRASLADPSIPPPVRLTEDRATKANARYRSALMFAQKLDCAGTLRMFAMAVRANTNRVSGLTSTEPRGFVTVLPSIREAAETGLPDASVDLVITSPPYCGAQKYIRTVRLELLLLGFPEVEIADADRRTLGTERVSATSRLPDRLDLPLCKTLYLNIRRSNPTRARIFVSYVTYLKRFATELERVLSNGAEAFVTFGTDHVAGYRVDCAKIFASLATDCGLKHIATLVDTIPSRGMITSRHASARTINDERVVWLTK